MGSLTLPTTGVVYIDANVAIYSVEKIEPYWTCLQPLWVAAQAGHFVIVSSELLFFETLVKPPNGAMQSWKLRFAACYSTRVRFN